MTGNEDLEQLPPDGGPRYNRLVFEKSPYLQQHAANPVDWYPWGEEAFAKAKAEDRPIFLSIGYSTCHWCHVMEKESFEDEEVAALLNEHFVSIKVDREERPDLDHIYMAVTQALTGSGGWPMTLVLTPEGKPSFAGTYFPKESISGRPGMLDLLPALAEAWKNRRGEVAQSADEITQWLDRTAAASKRAQVDEEILHEAYRDLAGRFDPAAGGFSLEPKFPTPHNLTFLLRYWKRTGEPHALDMVEVTLDQLRRGGIYDHVGFGFHRYSTDRRWLVPHFEKMLYDQALLADAYLETYQVTGREEYAVTAREIFGYVLREMTDPGGGFYSAEDADSEGMEGKFYVWTAGEVEGVLGELSELFQEVYGFERGGNYRTETTGTEAGTNIPHLRRPLEKIAEERGVCLEELASSLEDARCRLFELRVRRPHPRKDDKILTDWNGLMIASLAKGGRVLDEFRLIEAAEKAAEFIWASLRDGGGRLLKRWRQGSAGLRAYVDDYAFYVWGLIELYEAGFDVKHLERAVELTKLLIEFFYDEDAGGFFFTSEDTQDLLVRTKEVYDGAIPSGNSVAAICLLRLGRIIARPEWEVLAAEVLETFGGQLRQSPAGFTHLLGSLDFLIGPAQEVVIAGKAGADDTRAMLGALNRCFIPNAVVVFRPEDEVEPDISRLASYTLHQTSLDGRATAYVCRNYVCHRPTTRIDEMLELLTNPTPLRHDSDEHP